ncbi:HlyD family secretion protein [Pseudarcicella hirudinis]|uniref:HlyD family secretion protein n=1 Tax=Pseudarcicella hirudinis TaxID=1079859 RepID=A0A1I5TJ27_9BACT|nr:HlyD family efflux transporter periplasmic adaptor subunit [Pseudarcicella hirudinis]SFP82376.1 HlyD family secretion protein [Pseudarcicella hirudinis]
METFNEIEHKSEEIQEIIGQIPPWIVRWGITMIITVFIIFVLSSYYIRFPDVLHANVKVTAKDQPVKIGWYKTPGLSYQTIAKDAEMIKSGDTVLIEHNSEKNTNNYVIAPIGGKIFTLKGVENNPRKSMMIIYPPITNYEVQLNISEKGMGKTKVGQKVLLRLDAYPVEDFGFLEGEITEIIPVLVDNHYRAKIHLLQGFTTNTGKLLTIQHILAGDAEIMLDDKNLFHRIFGGII